MHNMRAFIAVHIPLEVKQKLQREIDVLWDLIRGDIIRWVKPAGIHLTLKFLGEITEGQVGEIQQVLQQDLALLPSLTISVGGFGCFPNPHRPRVLWVGIVGNNRPLLTVQSVIDQKLHSLGFDRERRPFHPHLTLGRVRRNLSLADLDLLQDVLDSYEIGQIGQFEVRKISLIRSILKPTGAEYSILGEYPLGAKENHGEA
jgi:2'-5' RNA ligase